MSYKSFDFNLQKYIPKPVSWKIQLTHSVQYLPAPCFKKNKKHKKKNTPPIGKIAVFSQFGTLIMETNKISEINKTLKCFCVFLLKMG